MFVVRAILGVLAKRGEESELVRARLLAVAVASTLVVGCHLFKVPAPRPPEPVDGASPGPLEGTIVAPIEGPAALPAKCAGVAVATLTDTARTEAMLSIHAHSYLGGSSGDPDMLGSLGVMELSTAARILGCDRHPLAPTRQRRAVAKLAAYSWRLDELERSQAELELLGLKVAQFQNFVQAQIPPVPHPTTTVERTHLEYQFGRLLWSMPNLVVSQVPDLCNFRPEDPYDPAQAIDSLTEVTVDTHVSVDPTRDQVARHIDPQSWDECSRFWPAPPPESTYLVDVTLGHSCRITVADTSVKTALPVGSDYPGWQYLYEHFVCQAAGCSSRFENVLSVHSRAVSNHLVLPGTTHEQRVDTFHVSYDLPTCGSNGFDGFLAGQIAGDPAVSVVVDRGTVDAWVGADGRTYVWGHKVVSFAPVVWTSSAAVVLGYTIAELNQELAELACCTGP